MDVAASSASSEPGNVPPDRSERRCVRMRGYAIRGDGTTHEVYVLDLSYEGCGVETPVAFEPSETIKLSVLQRGAIDAVVRWCRGGKAGLAFLPEKVTEKEHRPRNSERMRGTFTVDLRLSKRFKLHGDTAIEGIVEAFNVFDQARYGNPGLSLGTPTFGVITSADDGRIVQLGVKYRWR